MLKSNFTSYVSYNNFGSFFYTNWVNVRFLYIKDIVNKLVLNGVIFLAQHASIWAKFHCLISLRLRQHNGSNAC